MDKKEKALREKVELMKSGYGGLDRSGNIVDRRKHPEATPVKKNKSMGIPEAKSVAEEDIITALNNVARKYPACIVRQVGSFIVIAQSERDFYTKARKINNGDTKGFYTIEQALEL